MLQQKTGETSQTKQEYKSDINQVTPPQTVVEQAADSVNEANITEKTQDSFERQIELLEQKAFASTNAYDTRQYFDIIAELRKQQEMPTLLLRQERLQEKREADARLFQVAAALLSAVPGIGLIVAAVALHDPAYAVAGAPLVAIGAAAWSERVKEAALGWFSGKEGRGNNDKK